MTVLFSVPINLEVAAGVLIEEVFAIYELFKPMLEFRFSFGLIYGLGYRADYLRVGPAGVYCYATC